MFLLDQRSRLRGSIQASSFTLKEYTLLFVNIFPVRWKTDIYLDTLPVSTSCCALSLCGILWPERGGAVLYFAHWHPLSVSYTQHTNDFALYTEAIKFFNHPESMVRIAVRTITLNVYKGECQVTRLCIRCIQTTSILYIQTD